MPKRPSRIALALLIAATLACNQISAIVPTPTSGPELLPPPTPTLLPTATPHMTARPPAIPTPQATSPPLPTPTPEQPWLTGEIRLFPGPLHYEGDILSVEVVVQNLDDLPGDQITKLTIDNEWAAVRIPEPIYHPLLDDFLLFRDVWDTSGEEGLHELTVEIPADEYGQIQTLTTLVEILPADQRPTRELETVWEQHNTDCCTIFTLSGTAASRDIDQITVLAQQAVDRVEQLFRKTAEQPYRIMVIDNVWGNGGYSSQDGMVVSYVDRNYINLDLETILAHEIAHFTTFPQQNTPLILSEGLAVYAAGGHYGKEPIPERAAALLELERYVPLAELADHFQTYQHETAYIEAAGLTGYLIETYGLNRFLQLYNLTGLDNTGARWLDQALQETYNLTLDEVETDFTGWLQDHPTGTQVEDLTTTIAYYETMRRYQALYAPYGRLPDIQSALDNDLTALYMREPTEAENLALETLLVAANQALHTGRYEEARQQLDEINLVLNTGDFTRSPIVDYLAITNTLLSQGYEVQQIKLDENKATVQAIRNWPELNTLTLTRTDTGWQIDK